MAGPTVMFSLASAVATVYIYTVQIVTQLVTTSYQTGLFSVAFRVVVTTTTIPVLIGSAVMPILSRAARDSHAQMSYVTARFLEVSLAAGLGLSLVLSAAGPFVVSVIAEGHSYRPAGSVLALQAFAMVGTFTSAPSSFALLSLGHYWRLLASSTLALAATLLATVFLAHSDGATGAAVAMIIGEAVTALAMFGSLAWRRREFLPAPDRLARLLVAATLTSAVVFLLPAPSVARAAVAAVVYGVLLLVLRALPEEVLGTLRSTLPGA